jgi:hypothetical protein
MSSHFPEPASRGTAPSAPKPEDLARNICEVSGYRGLYLQIRAATVLPNGRTLAGESPQCDNVNKRHLRNGKADSK